MDVYEQKEKTSLMHQRPALSMPVSIGYLQTILNQAMLSPDLDGLACGTHWPPETSRRRKPYARYCRSWKQFLRKFNSEAMSVVLCRRHT